MRIKKSLYPPATDQPAVWLLGLRPAAATPKRPKRLARFRLWLHRWLSRIWPQRLTQNIGRLPDDTPVNLLELPYTKEEFRALPLLQRRQQLQHALHWLTLPNKQISGVLQIGMPLSLQTLLPASARSNNLADGWQLAAREFIRQMAAESGGLQAKQIAILGVEGASPAEQHICEALLATGSRPILYGSHALGLAEHYYQKYGIAIPVFGARKAIRSSQIILVLKGRPQTAAVNNSSKSVFYFREPHVRVPGSFRGRFSFGSFPAGQAAALFQHITLDK